MKQRTRLHSVGAFLLVLAASIGTARATCQAGGGLNQEINLELRVGDVEHEVEISCDPVCKGVLQGVDLTSPVAVTFCTDLTCEEVGSGQSGTPHSQNVTFDVLAGASIGVEQSGYIVFSDEYGHYTEDCHGSVGFHITIVGSGTTGGNTKDAGSAGDPVNTFTGELYNHYPADLRLGGPMPLEFRRYYASRILTDGLITGALGDNWLHNFDWKLTTSPTLTTVIDSTGREINFAKPFSSWRITGKVDIPFRLDEDAGEFTLADPRTDRLYRFDTAGRPIRIADGKGNVHTLTYSGGRLSEVSDGLGRALTFDYDGAGNLTSVSDGMRMIAFEQTGSDLTRVTDALGSATTFAYAPGGLMASSTRPAGNTPFTQSWSGDRVVSQADSSGNTTTFSYAPPETVITDPNGDATVHRHVPGGDLGQIIDPEGGTATLGVDYWSRRGSVTDRLGDRTFLTYDFSSGKLNRIDSPDGAGTSLSYTSRFIDGGRLYVVSGVTHPDGTQDSYGYDSSLNRTSHTDQAGEVATATYNTNGLALSMTNRLGGVTTMSYNADGTRHSTTDPAGNTTVAAYDAKRRLATITWGDGSTRSFTYNDNDQVIGTTDENGNSRSVSYDSNGRAIAVTNAVGATVEFTYDGNDRPVSITDALGAVAEISYGPTGRTASTTDALGNTLTLTRDSRGRVTALTDPLGNSHTWTFDAEDVLTASTDPLGNTTTYATDSMGRVTQRTSPLGHPTSYTYDTNGSPVSRTDALARTSTITLDSRAQFVRVELADGAIVADYERNALGQITAATDPNGETWTTGYDSQGRLVTRQDPLGNTVAVAYDSRSRPSVITYPGGAGSLTITRDPVGNPTVRSWSDGTTLTYGYDADNRLTSGTGVSIVRDPHGRIVGSNGIGVVRNLEGRLVSMTLAQGKTVSYGYDAAGRLTDVMDWIGGVSTFSYDAAGNLIDLSRPNGVDTVATFDADGRRTAISEGAISSIAISYDAVGQVTAVDVAVPLAPSPGAVASDSRTFDAASQVAGASYDSLGRLNASGGDSFAWNLASQMTGCTVAGTNLQATYDALGERVSRTIDGVTRSYVWNRALALSSISIERSGGTDLRYYIHSPGGILLYSVDAATDARRFYHFDAAGNTIFLTDDAGTAVASYAYTPFGQLTGSTGAIDNPFTWLGAFGVMDDENGLYYHRYRYYDSRSARFLSRDPMKLRRPKSLDPYQYALQNPLSFADVDGQAARSVSNLDSELMELEKLDQGGVFGFSGYLYSDPEFGRVETAIEELQQALEERERLAWSSGEVSVDFLLQDFDPYEFATQLSGHELNETVLTETAGEAEEFLFGPSSPPVSSAPSNDCAHGVPAGAVQAIPLDSPNSECTWSGGCGSSDPSPPNPLGAYEGGPGAFPVGVVNSTTAISWGETLTTGIDNGDGSVEISPWVREGRWNARRFVLKMMAFVLAP